MGRARIWRSLGRHDSPRLVHGRESRAGRRGGDDRQYVDHGKPAYVFSNSSLFHHHFSLVWDPFLSLRCAKLEVHVPWCFASCRNVPKDKDNNLQTARSQQAVHLSARIYLLVTRKTGIPLLSLVMDSLNVVSICLG